MVCRAMGIDTSNPPRRPPLPTLQLMPMEMSAYDHMVYYYFTVILIVINIAYIYTIQHNFYTLKTYSICLI